MIKQYLGIILSAIYALIIRVLGEWNIIEINSFSYLIVAPMALGFIPFYFEGNRFRKSASVAILYPLFSVIIFLIIAVITHLEDLICFAIIGIPYIIFSILVSLVLYYLTNENKEDEIHKSSLSILLLPILLGQIEKEFPKVKTDLSVSNAIVIDLPDTLVWNHLFEVPDLSEANSPGFINYLGIPQPVRSTYDSESNTRLGYFEKGVRLNESIVEQIDYQKLVFAIDINKSRFGSNPTLNHILKTKNMEFKQIQYELKNLDNGQTLLKLSTNYCIHSNLPFYGTFWSTRIIDDFEKKLLGSLKIVLEREEK
ncbi:hypothetical protein D3C71_535530 [compost metagenome]